MSLSLEEILIQLTEEKNWREILLLGECYTQEELSRFLWAWPCEECLDHLKRTFQKNHIHNILSIGCGSGLLEWIIGQATGITVSGLEIDNSWWTSIYSPKTFIKLNFTTDVTHDSLYECATKECSANDNGQFALLFCYFNNRCAFNEYVKAYDGRFIIIIGPEDSAGIHTDPLPLEPNFEYCSDYTWKIDTVINIANSKNVIVIYKKIDFT